IACSEFEKLVAESNAGYFDRAGIALDKMVFEIDIGYLSIRERKCNDDGLEQLLHLRNRLFDRISFGDFYIYMDGSPSALHFIRQFMRKFETKSLSLHVQCQPQLDSCSQTNGRFSAKRLHHGFHFVPEAPVIRSFPRMQRLDIVTTPVTASQIPTEVFFTMLSSHTDLYLGLGSVLLTSDEWEKTMKVYSHIRRQLRSNRSTSN
ncbi:hypothetical protein PENTCL1PPCAC_20216, partial [Pristionchus entomophagus]